MSELKQYVCKLLQIHAPQEVAQASPVRFVLILSSQIITQLSKLYNSLIKTIDIHEYLGE